MSFTLGQGVLVPGRVVRNVPGSPYGASHIQIPHAYVWMTSEDSVEIILPDPLIFEASVVKPSYDEATDNSGEETR